MNPNTATEYRNLSLTDLTESTTNPRRIFAEAAIQELAQSIRVQGVLSPLLVRPTTGQNFEIVAGARRYRAAEQDKRRREEALANVTGMRVLQTIVTAVPVRLMKKDFLFIAEQMLPSLDDKRLEMVARNRGIPAKEGESGAMLLTAFLRKAHEGVIGKLIVEAVILLSASKQSDGAKILRAAAQAYKVDTDAIALKVKHEFAAKAKGGKKPQTVVKPTQKRVA